MVLTGSEFEAAEVRGQAALESAPRAASVSLASGRTLILELTNGCRFAFPADLVQELHGAATSDLAQAEVQGAGLTLHWPSIDADVHVPSLLAGSFGTREWMESRDKGESNIAKRA